MATGVLQSTTTNAPRTPAPPPPPPAPAIPAPPPVAPAPAPAPVTAPPAQGPTTITPSNNSLVSSQIDKLLKKDSPLVQAATTRAMQSMNSRGLTNSSMAAGAGVLAAIDSVTPIAQQDASTNFTAQRDNFEATNTFRRDNNDRTWRTTEAERDRRFTSSENLAAAQRRLTEMGYNFRLTQAAVPGNFATGMATMLFDRIAAIQADPNLDAKAKEGAITNLVNGANATLGWAEGFYGGSFTRFSTGGAGSPTPAPAPPPRTPTPAPPPRTPARTPAPSPYTRQNGGVLAANSYDA